MLPECLLTSQNVLTGCNTAPCRAIEPCVWRVCFDTGAPQEDALVSQRLCLSKPLSLCLSLSVTRDVRV